MLSQYPGISYAVFLVCLRSIPSKLLDIENTRWLQYSVDGRKYWANVQQRNFCRLDVRGEPRDECGLEILVNFMTFAHVAETTVLY